MVRRLPARDRESHCELSDTGWRADLYSAFGVQRKSRGIYPLINCGERFSATGRRGRFAKIPAKRDDFCALTSYFSDNNDLMAEKSGFEHVIHIVLCQQVTCFRGFAGSLFPV